MESTIGANYPQRVDPQGAVAALNGFGRFGLGLFRAWFNDSAAAYQIRFINDDVLTADDIATILREDPVVLDFHGLAIDVRHDALIINRPHGEAVTVSISTGGPSAAPWKGIPDLVFECSGRPGNLANARTMVVGNTRCVVLGAVPSGPEAILVMGFNHHLFDCRVHDVVSFGSCTVIPGIHVLRLVQSTLGLRGAIVNIVHSVPAWQLAAGHWRAIRRKECSLERVAPLLMDLPHPSAIKVNYTNAPYAGVSLMDFALDVEQATTAAEVGRLLQSEIGRLGVSSIVGWAASDEDGEAYAGSLHSIVLVATSIDVRDRTVHVFGYFNNEGSGIRLHELANHITRSLAAAPPGPAA